MLSPAFFWLCLEVQEEGGCREELLFPVSFSAWEAVASLDMVSLPTPLAVGRCQQCRFWGDAVQILGRGQCRGRACSLPSPQVRPALAQNHAAPGARLGGAVPAVGERQREGSGHGDGRGVPAVGAAPPHRRDPGRVQAHPRAAAAGEEEDEGGDGSGAEEEDSRDCQSEDAAHLRPQHAGWDR